MRLSNKVLIDDLAEINQNLENLVTERTAELEASERQSNSIIEQSSDAIVVIEGDGNVLVWNARAEQMFGHSRDGMGGQSIKKIIPEVYVEKHEVALNAAMKSGSLKNPGVVHELAGLRKDGSEFPLELAISTWELAGKNFFSASIRDITKRKEAERAIREQEERIRSIVEIAPDAIISINGEHNITMFNSQAEETFGYPVEEVMGQPLTMLMPEASRANHPHEVERFLNEPDGARSMDDRREIFGRRKDGTIFPAEAGISKLELDEQVVFTAFFRDITERKRAEEALQRSEERLAFALEGSNDGLWDWKPQTDALFLSPRWQTMLGFEPGELKPVIGTWEKLIHPEDLDRVSEIMAEHLAGNSPSYESEYRLQSKSGEWVWILARGKVASYDEDGKPIRFVGTHVDISERKRMEADIADQLSFIRTLVDTIPNPIFALGPDQRYILFNQSWEEAYGVDGETLIGSTVRDSDNLSLEKKELYYAQNLALLENGGMNHDELEIRYADGKMHTILQWVTTFERSDGSIGGLVGTSADITVQKEMERLLEIANERMSTELNFARDIQLDMLPLIFPAFPNRTEVSIYAELESAREVGGDFYDFYFLDDVHLCFVIGDVADKGAPGALMMAVSKTLIKSRASDDNEPASILTHVNDELSHDNKSSMFVTVFLGIINVKTGELVYTNAGHNPPYIRRSDGSLQKIDAFHGPVIGAMPGLSYQQDNDLLGPGDVILLYTDGVTEAFNEEEELYSEARLEALLPSATLDSAENIVVGTIAEVNQFTGEAEQSDDITLLAVQYLGLPEEMTVQELDITIKNSYEDMGIIDELFSKFAKENDLADTVRQSMSIVLDEMLNNIISYAYQGEKEKEINVHFELSGNRLVLMIKDSGVPFNPFTREIPDISESVEVREIGGLGIHMVRSMMDEVSYQRQINENVVTLVKLLDE
jgi:sigma-B regulation protein RsbU (phosphoserine phosphatase)